MSASSGADVTARRFVAPLIVQAKPVCVLVSLLLQKGRIRVIDFATSLSSSFHFANGEHGASLS